MATSNPRPRDLGTEGRKLWDSVVRTYDLAAHEARLLAQACRVADLVTQLDAITASEGVLTAEGKAAPAVVEARLQRLALARLVAALRLPDLNTAARPQRRDVRGVYSIKGSA